MCFFFGGGKKIATFVEFQKLKEKTRMNEYHSWSAIILSVMPKARSSSAV
jgi:hypothetical protein